MRLPTSILTCDGRTVPFEPDRISRSLFAVTELMGAPNAFLARELTDGVLHFIGLEPEAPATTSDLADMVAKVVRELGYPAIARVYEENVRTASRQSVSDPTEPLPSLQNLDPFATVHRAAREQLKNFSLERAYPRDLVSAHRNGLLHLLDLDHPNEMSGTILSPGRPLPANCWEFLETIVAARSVAGSFIAIDSPEWALATQGGAPEEVVDAFLQSLEQSLRLTGLHAILNLNIVDPPAWATWSPTAAAQTELGPLFRDVQKEVSRDRMEAIGDLLLDKAVGPSVFWHLSDCDFRDEAMPRLQRLAARALVCSRIRCVFDRARLPVQLGPGVDRTTQSALGFAGINLVRLAEQMGAPIDPELYFRKLGSLARFAKSAGRSRQDFLRRNGRPELQHGFLLERAAQIVIPIGTLEAAQLILGGHSNEEHLYELAGRTLDTIRNALDSDRPQTIPARIDGQPDCSSIDLASFKLLPRQQLRIGSKVLKAIPGAALTIRDDQQAPLNVDEVVELLRASRKLDLGGIGFSGKNSIIDEKNV